MEIVIRATVIFWLLWILLRASGKRELAELTPFEMIVLIVMGDLIQQGVTQEDMSVTGAALTVSTITLWMIALSYASFRSRKAAAVLESKPSILASHGEIDEEMLKLQRLSMDDFLDEARTAGIDRISHIEWAVLEADGKVSFIRRDGGEVQQQDEQHIE